MFEFDNARDQMVESQIRTSDVTDLAVLKSFRSVPREAFVPKSRMALAYADTHVELQEGRYMLRPRDIAKMVQAADIGPDDVVLDIACGRGYSTAILAGIADTVVALEDSDEQVERASEILVAQEVMNAAVIKGDLKSGAAEHGPFDVIFINGAITEIPEAWTKQLSDGGRLVCIVDKGAIGHACVFTRSGDTLGERLVFDAQVPLLPQFERKVEFSL